MKKLFLLLISIFTLGAAIAQVTTSGMNGMVTDQNGEPLIGATVVAVHTPSGTQYGAITNKDGRYNLQGMRTGGPYTATISFVGCKSVEFTGINLQLGEYMTRDAFLKASTDIDAVEVVSTAGSRFNGNKTGAATNFDSKAIASIPTIDRSIYDIVKMTPQASVNKTGGMSFAGSNNRYNSFQIDGAVSNDVFGLTSTGMNGGQTGSNVVSLDAIEEIQVVVAPFDVRQSGFTGGGINAITKSGTNRFTGSAYSYYNNQDFFGTTPGKDVKDRQPLSTQATKTFGASIGGPIIKDKLFFFVNGEFSKEQYPSSYFPGYSDSYVTIDEATKIVNKYKELTGIEEGFGRRDIIKQSVDIMARLDWNINQNNKLSVRYQLKDAYKDNYGPSKGTYYFNNSAYKFSDKTHSIVAELNSRLSNNVSNELRVGYTRVRDNRDVPYQMPNVEINNLGSASAKGYIGTEFSSGANRLDQDIYTITDNLSIYKGTHTITIGTHNEFYQMENLFVQGNNGCYYYEDLDHFLSGDAWKYQWKFTDKELTGSSTWASNFAAAQYGFYVQDEWKPTKNFTMTYGVRMDIPVLFDNPTYNKGFNGSDYSQDGKHVVGRVPSAKVLWSPRIGFRYYLNEDHKTLVRGGVGIFTGRVPFVWLSNAYGNTGMEMKGVTLEAPKKDGVYDYENSTVPGFSTTPQLVEGKPANPDIAIVAEDFKYPQVLRANLAFEQIVGNGWKFTVEGIYSKTMNNVFFENLAAKDDGKKVYAVSQEAATDNNTTTYYNTNTGSYASIINLKNTNKGYTYNLSALVEKHFNFGLDLTASYAFGHSYSVNDGTSSVASSNWKYNYAIRTNDPNELSYALFDIPHRINAVVSYTSTPYAKGRLQTIVSLAYQGYSGQRYAPTMNESVDFNGDRQNGNSMLYIPTDNEIDKMTWAGNSSMKLDADQAKAAFKEWCATDDYAKGRRGEWAERYGAIAPFEHHFDLHIAQNFFYDRKNGRKIQLSLDILNIGNMFNRDWGTYYSSAYNLQVLKVTAVGNSADGNKVPTYTWNGNTIGVNDVYSRWHMQLGVRVTF